jgi:hypothetical protein
MRSVSALLLPAVLVALIGVGVSGGGGVLAQPKASAPEKEFEDFERSHFERPTTIDNPWSPMKPGMRWVLKGFTTEGGKRVPHRLVITVTDLTKTIDGVRTVVIWMEDFRAGQLMEKELAFFAQDKDGNVWAMGEHPEEYEDGKFAKAPTWIHGIEGSRAGIAMPGAPKLGMPSYSQGWAPSVNFTDRAVVDQVGQKTCVPLRCFEDVLLVAEGSKEEVDAQQIKYYARGVGKIRVGWRGKGEKLQEVLELAEVSQLGPDALAKARVAALQLEKNAYKVSKEVYGRTSPSEYVPVAKGQ